MPGLSITGTGRHLPGRPYTNHDLARVMDTNDAWIRQRTGIVQRHFSPEGMGAADLALPAAQQALEAAGRTPDEVDYILFNTMTPDYLFPGSGALLASRLGCTRAPALDLRVQCAAMIFSVQVASSLIKSGAASNVLIVGAEAHAGFMPWRDWDILEGTSTARPSPEAWERATRHRGWAVIFGDGAGAVLLEKNDRPESGLLGMDLRTEGEHAQQLFIPTGFRSRQYVTHESVSSDAVLPVMAGREIYKHAVTKLPKSVHAACKQAGVQLEQIDWFVAHQANLRINDAISAKLGVDPERMPSNIERYGNTSAATIPILLDEMRRDGRVKPGQLLCFIALGAGIHWGTAIFRV
jgi:3-oxoacyl-[acyl-carrier-protein] synthase-3